METRQASKIARSEHVQKMGKREQTQSKIAKSHQLNQFTGLELVNYWYFEVKNGSKISFWHDAFQHLKVQFLIWCTTTVREEYFLNGDKAIGISLC